MTSRERGAARARPAQAAARRRLAIKIAGFAGAGVLALGAIYWFNSQSSAQSQSAARDPLAGQYAFRVGKPGPGATAPAIRLASTTGGNFNLSAALRGGRVLLYFQEGVMCQPCWAQLRDIESSFEQFRALGIEAVVTITTDPIGTLTQKAAIERLSTPVLSDPDLRVSKAYGTIGYGMMGGNYNGHSFILLDREGKIVWRADYGGAPKYTMYVPIRNLIADLREGLRKSE